MRTETMVTNGTLASSGPVASVSGGTSSQRRSGLPMSPKAPGGDDDGTAPPVDPSPPRASRWPSAKTRHPPANTHSAGTAGAGVAVATGVPLALDRAVDVGAATTTADRGGGGKTRSHGLTTAAPRKIPTR